MNFPLPSRNPQFKNGKATTRDKQDRSQNKSQTSVSPATSYKEKPKPVGKMIEMKRSFTKTVGPAYYQNKHNETTNPAMTSEPKGNDPKER